MEPASVPGLLIIWHFFIYCPGDSPVIFDMEKDPEELENLAGSSEVVDIEAAFVQEIESKWDIADLTERIITSQKQRRLILEALLSGEPSPWDYQPVIDAYNSDLRKTRSALQSIIPVCTELEKGITRILPSMAEIKYISE